MLTATDHPNRIWTVYFSVWMLLTVAAILLAITGVIPAN